MPACLNTQTLHPSASIEDPQGLQYRGSIHSSSLNFSERAEAAPFFKHFKMSYGLASILVGLAESSIRQHTSRPSRDEMVDLDAIDAHEMGLGQPHVASPNRLPIRLSGVFLHRSCVPAMQS